MSGALSCLQGLWPGPWGTAWQHGQGATDLENLWSWEHKQPPANEDQIHLACFSSNSQPKHSKHGSNGISSDSSRNLTGLFFTLGEPPLSVLWADAAL